MSNAGTNYPTSGGPTKKVGGSVDPG